jgi:hypothetical protein
MHLTKKSHLNAVSLPHPAIIIQHLLATSSNHQRHSLLRRIQLHQRLEALVVMGNVARYWSVELQSPSQKNIGLNGCLIWQNRILIKPENKPTNISRRRCLLTVK